MRVCVYARARARARATCACACACACAFACACVLLLTYERPPLSSLTGHGILDDVRVTRAGHCVVGERTAAAHCPREGLEALCQQARLLPRQY